MIRPLFVAFIIYVHHAFAGYIEKVIVRGCESCQLMLTCRQLDSLIAILDVDFQAESSVYDTGLMKNRTMRPFPPDHPRDSLNKRCSGLSHCSFILTEDSPGSEAFGPGNVTIKYACATGDKVHPYCNTDIHLNNSSSSGFIHNPGYPRLYAGQKKCVWKITAPLYQKVRLRILDVALFDTKVLSQEECRDVLEVIDSDQAIYSTCTQEHPPVEVVSASEVVELVLTSRQLINPRRGVLIYYSIEGCSLVPPPKNAYLVSYNDTIATYSCRRGYVFPDTQTKTRSISCFAASWNVSTPLLDCEWPGKVSEAVINLKSIVQISESMASELVAPIVLMLILFALNGVVVFYIYRARKNSFRHRRPSNFGNREWQRGRLYYGSMENHNNCSLRGKSSKLQTKNWEPSLKVSNEKWP
ncbi:uncharacterized protein [Euwallacea similis]|uniref:uncharacterized protein isoform X1 n=1 Tax=Euwallacea similis TaxID=1736056 RepID=UPI00344EABBD